MTIWGLDIIDFVVLVVYLIGITSLGLWMSRTVRSMSDFIMPRRFGKWFMIFHAFGTGTHSDQAVGVAAKTYTNGLSGIWYQWLWLFCTPFYWVIAPMMRRFRALTTADVFEVRFDRSVSMLYAVVGSTSLAFNMGLMLLGSAKVIAGITGQAVSTDVAIAVMTVLFVAYGVAGGLSAAIVTDFVQGILTVVFSFMLLPPIMRAVGGMAGLRASIADPHMFSLVAPAEIGVFYVAVIALNALIGIVTQPHIMGVCGAGRTEAEGQVGFMVGNFIKRFCTMAWCLTGLAAVAYFAGRELDPDTIYGAAARDFLPAIMPGLIGVFVATLLASVMSSCDSFMIATSALLSENVYRRLVTGKDERHYVAVARLMAFLVVAVGVGCAYWLGGNKDVRQGLEIFWKISSMVAIAFWLGLFWRRTTVAGAWASTLAALATWWLTGQGFFIQWLSQRGVSDVLRMVVEKEGALQIYLPWQMILYTVAGVIAGVIVSLVTEPVPEDQLERYYQLIRTPVQPGEVITEPCALPEGVEPGPRRVLLPESSLELPMPSPRGVLGFLGGWLLVAAIIFGFMALIS